MNQKETQIYLLCVNIKIKNVEIVIDYVYKKRIMKDNVIVIQIIYVLKNVKYKVANKKVDSVGSQVDIMTIIIIVLNLIIIVNPNALYKGVRINVKESQIIQKSIIIVNKTMNANKNVVQKGVRNNAVRAQKKITYINVKIINAHFNVYSVERIAFFRIIFMVNI